MARGVAHTTRTIELPEVYDADRLFGFLHTRAIPGVEAVEHSVRTWTYRRSLRLSHGPASAQVVTTAGSAELSITCAKPTDIDEGLAALLSVLDLHNDPLIVDRDLAQHPETAALVTRLPGLRVPRAADRAEVAFRALIGQQVSVAAASTTCGFIAAEYGESLPDPLRSPGIDMLWPSPEVLSDLDPLTLRMPRTKATAVCTLAAALRDGDVGLDLAPDVVRAQLVALRGIGPWTAGYISMRACRDDDVLLDGDLIVRRGAALVGLPEKPRDLRAASTRFSPWRSYLTMHLWQAYAAG